MQPVVTSRQVVLSVRPDELFPVRSSEAEDDKWTQSDPVVALSTIADVKRDGRSEAMKRLSEGGCFQVTGRAMAAL